MAETEKRFCLRKQQEQEAGKKESLCVQDFNKRCARVISRVRELENVHNGIVKQFVQETCDCCHKTAKTNYFTNEEALF